MSYGPDTVTLTEDFTPNQPPAPATSEKLAELKREMHERFSEEELHKLKDIADVLRRPMNRKQRRALMSHHRRKGW